jgi:hypothetical protein
MPKKPTIYVHSYDPECEQLAAHFLQDDVGAQRPLDSREYVAYEERVRSLAADIQQAVEAWCNAQAEVDSEAE